MIFAGPLFQARMTARLAARRAIFGAVGGLFLLVGLGFLTGAIWIVLATAFGPLSAALILALLFLGAGLCILAYGRRPPRLVSPRAVERIADPTRPAAPGGLASAGLVSAFLWGLSAGRGARRRR